jgi:hypothetical protein
MQGYVIPIVAIFLSSSLLGSCAAERVTSPARTATEELLISTAADRAAEKLAEQIPTNTKVLLATTSVASVDERYATAAIRDRLVRRGVVLVDDKASADVVVEARTGALSTDERSVYLGTPQLQLPAVPGVVTTGIPLPSLSVFKRSETKATAKFEAIGYNAKTGQLVVATEPQYGHSQKVDWTILFLLSWTNADYVENESGTTLRMGIAPNTQFWKAD